MTEWIGQSVKRVGGAERVTGAQKYVGDIRLDGMLWVKLVTLDCGHARITGIDATGAEKLPGVRCVMTARDLPQPVPRFGPNLQDRPVIAVGETKFFGEPVAAVAAETEDAAREAAALVRVAHEKLPGVYTVDEALDPGAPLVQDPVLRPKDALKDTNVLEDLRFGWGDVDALSADLVIQNVYTFPMVTHFAIEPHA